MFSSPFGKEIQNRMSVKEENILSTGLLKVLVKTLDLISIKFIPYKQFIPMRNTPSTI